MWIVQINVITLILINNIINHQFSIDKEPNRHNGDKAEDCDEDDMAQGVAGLPDHQENVTQGAVVGELPEARETADLEWDILQRHNLFWLRQELKKR